MFDEQEVITWVFVIEPLNLTTNQPLIRHEEIGHGNTHIKSIDQD